MYPASLSASGPRGKKPRSLTAAQLAVLTEKFAQNQYLQESEAAELSGMLGMTVKQVHNWYGKRRYTLKQKAAQNPGPSHSFEESEVTSNAGGSNSIDESAQFDSDQLQQLEAAYERNHIINYKEAEILSLRLNIPAIKIRVW
ncbi:hypothetical protein BC830DRAFT_487617 [Chytriomyces sp. MP71]|nr:hypothetical protein BC830DRAFT_487617 [Chytriomyces sp. MP71]